ncbi:ribosome-associated ATPase/putative transporter RbbA [Ferrovibrio sp.]|jgi:ribosome-dependent ATPase|uniref:ribosome-associated ATPase/putative transporter RbbA n=1 Tax=Ferrovibrio sp. TaxID=1917215 RepID=UPI0035B210CD
MNAGDPHGGLSIAHVSHRYGKTVALEDVSLDLAPGAALALVGPDGVGKSTLLALASGAKKLQQGSITALGADYASRNAREGVQPRIAYMPQGLGRNLYANLTVAENVAFFARLFGHDRAERDRRIPILLEATGLSPFADRPMHKLSGGMKQKLGLCCALVHDPDLLILDEPTTGVDPLSRRQFWDLIETIRQSRPQLALLVATSTMDEAERFSHVMMLDQGRILAGGSPADLKAQSGTASLEQAFIALLPKERRGGLDGEPALPPPRFGETEEPVIAAKGLTRRFGDFTAVDHVDLAIRRGEIFGFLGSNGCGKTTTMKMLTGLLSATEGEGFLFGQAISAGDFSIRRRIGYMAQSFSLYGELTVRQNLMLHAALYGLDNARALERSKAMVSHFDLKDHLDAVADTLPMGVRQRLSLAVAIIHDPEILILDEPTSGVDPVARESFWRELLRLAREQGVTIFISTHYMTEATRCDRVAFMHAGRVIATGAPAELQQAQNAASLEEAFISYMELGGRSVEEPTPAIMTAQTETPAAPRGWFSGRRLRAYAWRESIELLRDPIRLAFALFGTVILMLVFGFGITFDVDNVTFSVLDRDGTPESRAYVETYSGSSYFKREMDAADGATLVQRLRGNRIALAIEIPPNFGADLRRGRAPEVSVWIDGGMPFRAETIEGYVNGAHASFLADLARQQGISASPSASLVMRYRYNQAFRSIDAMVPALFAMMLMLIPAILATLGVVSERERGSITNLYVTPVRKLEFLLGKQAPYVALAYVNVLVLTAMAVFIFGVPLKGSLLGLLIGGFFYVLASTGIGMVTSCFTQSQVAAMFGTAVLTIMPTVHFSGLMQPVSTLQGGARLIGSSFPATYFLRTSVGAFTKGLGLVDLIPFILATAAFWPILLAMAWLFLRKQEA